MMAVDIQREQRQAGVDTTSQTSAQQGIGGSAYARNLGRAGQDGRRGLYGSLPQREAWCVAYAMEA